VVKEDASPVGKKATGHAIAEKQEERAAAGETETLEGLAVALFVVN